MEADELWLYVVAQLTGYGTLDVQQSSAFTGNKNIYVQIVQKSAVEFFTYTHSTS